MGLGAAPSEDSNTKIDVDLLKNRDPAEWQKIMTIYRPRLLRSVTKRITQKGRQGKIDPEDIIQETFIIAYKKIDAFQGNCEILTWLTAIAFNLITDGIRKRSSDPDLEIEFEHSEHTNPSDDPETALIVHETSRRLKEIIDRLLLELPENQAAVIRLRMEGYCHKEIAEKLGIPRQTAGTRFFYGKDKIISSLGDLDPNLLKAILSDNMLKQLAVMVAKLKRKKNAKEKN